MNMEYENIFLGTGNTAKIIEIKKFFQLNSRKYRIHGDILKMSVEEYGSTFTEISQWKAVKYSENFLNKLVLCDDSGLCIDCIGGRPGIFSARFPYEGVSKEERLKAMIRLLKAEGDTQRTATFYSAISLGLNGKILFSVLGTCSGKVILESRGGNGFGFDSIFIPHNCGKTFAEMSVVEKLNVSHRGKALKKLLSCLEV